MNKVTLAKQAVTFVALAGLLLTTGVSAATTTVTTAGGGGWLMQSDSCAVGAIGGSSMFEAGPGVTPAGIGSLEQRIGSNGFVRQAIGQTAWSGVPLASISELRYSTYVDQPGQGGQAPYMILNVDHNGDMVVDDHLFFEPAYQNSVLTGLPLQGQVSGATWQTWDALRGGWWSEKGIAGATSGGGVRSLTAYLAAQPNARLLNNSTDNTAGLRIASGCGGSWSGFIGNVDRVVLGNNAFTLTGVATTTTPSTGVTATSSLLAMSTVYDFEPAAGTISALMCSPAIVSAAVGQPVTFSASGASGSYVWSGTGLTITNPTGTQFTVTYSSPSVNTITVSSAGQTASCRLVVTGTSPVPPVVPPVFPGLPNTGAGGDARLLMSIALAIIALVGVQAGSYLYSRRLS
ncbi:MAG: hypothetical protein A2542_00395 [Parcubacteria group bacterium RIFOXYD2_FULL_52_8]|nr:MAG: hypothetical protein A2542_00395 [Parcubacteria group bacterium RIFOXYD2_FULL_52_8]